ncbi:MAG: response regulator transcription factor [Chloroflexota bacterium]|nr:response regulator transcription factor [Chloroflexota bacterium]PLS78383.1 MAG: DNA-binding response regulator [Chloroflexota bacterium]
MAIRVVLADDHSVVRKGVREFLEEEPDIDVIGEASDGLQAVELAVTLQPDVVVMDIKMPQLSGVDATKRIRSVAPKVRVLALTAYDDDPYVFGLLEAGAGGYVLKTAESRELVRAIRAVAAGQSALDPAIASRLVTRVGQHPPGGESLTDRELEVLRLAARGLTNKQIGHDLDISDRTVQNHLANIYAKLGVASRTEAVTAGLQRGLFRLGE